MLNRIATLLCCAVALTLAARAQTNEPVLISASIPQYPALARQARVVGVVKVSFILEGKGSEPTNIKVTLGHPLLNDPAIANLKTWRFDNSFAVERKYETTFEYLIGGGQSVCFESFDHVRIVVPEPIVIEPNF